MAASLIAVSFLCAILLAVFIPVKRVYSDIPSLAIVLWLFVANLIHGVNSALFANTVEVESFVWCDISTKLLLGVHVAIPGAFLCIGRHLEQISSSRKIFVNSAVKRNTMIFELLFCYVIPIIYMSLHVIAQHHRFDIIEDFGCFAAIHPSTPGVVLVWVLPLVFGAVSLLLSAAFAVKHSLRFTKTQFSAHMEGRTDISYSLFVRRATSCIIMTLISVITTLFSLFLVPTLLPWTSWEHTHQAMSKAVVLTVPDEINNTRLTWWTIFAMSVAYILLSFALGEEPRDSAKWIHKTWLRRNELFKWTGSLKLRRPALPRHTPRVRQPASPVRSLPHMVDLRSGWDDMVDFKPAKSTWSSKRSNRSDTTSPLSSPISSRSPSAASFRGERSPTTGQMSSEDQAFMDSTLSYLGSPTAHTLGIASSSLSAPQSHLAVPASTSTPVRTPAAAPTVVVPRKVVPPLSLVIADPVLPRDTPEFMTPTVRSPAPVKPGTTISSVIRADWPVPPQSPSPVASLSSSSRHGARSPTHSASSSIEEEVTSYTSHTFSSSALTQPPNAYVRPFESSGAAAVYGGFVSPQQYGSSTSMGRGPSLKASLQSLRDSWDKGRTKHNSGQSPRDGILMTVVQETV
ncbi:hypothetical protein MD484_g4055, partial [Candolleomyces efflorescens]